MDCLAAGLPAWAPPCEVVRNAAAVTPASGYAACSSDCDTFGALMDTPGEQQATVFQAPLPVGLQPPVGAKNRHVVPPLPPGPIDPDLGPEAPPWDAAEASYCRQGRSAVGAVGASRPSAVHACNRTFGGSVVTGSGSISGA